MTNEEGHRKLWGRLAETGGDSKGDVFEELWPEEPPPINHCFACQESNPKYDFPDCSLCPIEWSGDNCENEEFGGEFYEWYNAETPEERKHWAAIIRDMEWKEVKKIIRYFFISYSWETGTKFGDGELWFNKIGFPSADWIKKQGKVHGTPTNANIIITNIFEFKNELDFNAFCDQREVE